VMEGDHELGNDDLELVETYRDVRIFATGAADTRRYRIEESVAETTNYGGSNGDLEDDLFPLAKSAGKVVAWAREIRSWRRVTTRPRAAG